ncbi:hypothetical protein EBL85_16655 [Marichromatium sp. AB32]|nr:hypothetical protein EBL85_16655 [Marichromatium sp. AB32]
MISVYCRHLALKGHPLTVDALEALSYASSNTSSGDALSPSPKIDPAKSRDWRHDGGRAEEEQRRNRKGHPLIVDAPKALSYASSNTSSGDAP